MNEYEYIKTSPKKLATKADEALKAWDGKEMTLEEMIEDDIEGGYFDCCEEDNYMDGFFEESRCNMEGFNNRTEENTFCESKYPMPICNHTKCVRVENIGYTQAIAADGTPFEAELTSVPNENTVHIISPEIPEFYDERDIDYTQNEALIGYKAETKHIDYGILKIGMADRELDSTFYTLQNYLDYFVNIGILNFPDNYYNGAIWWLTDIEGNDLVDIAVTLDENDFLFAECNLNFKPFPLFAQKKKCDIIKIDQIQKK